jgi:hypothetical protein
VFSAIGKKVKIIDLGRQLPLSLTLLPRYKKGGQITLFFTSAFHSQCEKLNPSGTIVQSPEKVS